MKPQHLIVIKLFRLEFIVEIIHDLIGNPRGRIPQRHLSGFHDRKAAAGVLDMRQADVGNTAVNALDGGRRFEQRAPCKILDFDFAARARFQLLAEFFQ